jgi:hypothetical protein
VVRGDGRSATHRPDGRQGASGARRGAPRLAGQALRHERLRESRGDARRRRHQRAVLEDDGGEASGGAVLLRRGGGRRQLGRFNFQRGRRVSPPGSASAEGVSTANVYSVVPHLGRAAGGPGTPARPDGQTDAWLTISNWMVGWARQT